MQPTWFERDLPVLDAVVAMREERAGPAVNEGAIAQATGFDLADVKRALEALNGRYVELSRDLSGFWVYAVTEDARRAVGQWPTGESLVNQLVEGLTAAAEAESDPEQQNRLRQVAGFLVGAGRTIAINVASAIVQHQIPGAH